MHVVKLVFTLLDTSSRHEIVCVCPHRNGILNIEPFRMFLQPAMYTNYFPQGYPPPPQVCVCVLFTNKLENRGKRGG